MWRGPDHVFRCRRPLIRGKPCTVGNHVVDVNEPLILVDHQLQQVQLRLPTDAQILDVFDQGLDLLVGERAERRHGGPGHAAEQHALEVLPGRFRPTGRRGVLIDAVAEVARIRIHQRGGRSRPVTRRPVTCRAMLPVQPPLDSLGIDADRAGSQL